MKVAVFPSVPAPELRDPQAGGAADPGAFLRFWTRSMGAGAETALPAPGLADGAGPGTGTNAPDAAWPRADMPDEAVALQPVVLPDGVVADRTGMGAAGGDAGLAPMPPPAEAVSPDPAASFAVGGGLAGPASAPESTGTELADRVLPIAVAPREIPRVGADLPAPSVRPLPAAPAMPTGAETAPPDPLFESPPAPGRVAAADGPVPVATPPSSGPGPARQPHGRIALASLPGVTADPPADRPGHPAAASLPNVPPAADAPAPALSIVPAPGGATPTPDNPVASGPAAIMVRTVGAVRDGPMPVSPHSATERAALPLAPGLVAATDGDPGPVREVAIRVALAHGPDTFAADRPVIRGADAIGAAGVPVPPQAWPLVLARLAGGGPGLVPSGPAVMPVVASLPTEVGGLPAAQPTVAPPPQAPSTPVPTAAGQAAAARDGALPFSAPGEAADPPAGPAAPEPPLPGPPGAPPPSGPHAVSRPALPEPQPRPELPPPARQMADALRLTGGNRVELVLMPEELGRVTISFQGEGDTLRVHLGAERPETLDLLRRHAPDLAAELRAMGYDTAGFSFGDSRHPQPGQVRPDDPDAEDGAPRAALPASGPVARPAVHGLSGSLDLRL